MGQGAARGIDGQPFQVGDVEFVPAWERPSQRGSLTLLKSKRMVSVYRDLLAGFDRPNLVELGISQGGSVALLALMAQPRRMVAVELSDEPITALAETLADQGLSETVRPHYGVDQADRARLAAIVSAEFGDEPLDVVIDDASHRYGPTVASFEVLFPRLRPGGLYVIEDWSWEDLFGDRMAAAFAEGRIDVDRLEEVMRGEVRREPPLSLLALHAVMARARSGDAIGEVRVDEDWIVVTRGEGELDPEGFRLEGLFTDHFGVLSPF